MVFWLPKSIKQCKTDGLDSWWYLIIMRMILHEQYSIPFHLSLGYLFNSLQEANNSKIIKAAQQKPYVHAVHHCQCQGPIM